MPNLLFFTARNLKDPELTEGKPWDFLPPTQEVEAMRDLPKAKRTARMSMGTAEWNVYSGVRGRALNQRVCSANPAVGLRGLVADYDMKMSVADVLRNLDQIEAAFLPNFIEVTLSKRIRLVWLFEREILIPDSRFYSAVVDSMFELMRVPRLLAGFDPKSSDAGMVWTNGGEWHTIKEEPMPWTFLFGILSKASKKVEGGTCEIPLDVIYEQVKKQFPGRWKGEFKKDATGIRFWDERADNPTGCQIKADGMLCFTGTVPFMRWEAIFGAAWVNAQKSYNLGKIAGEIFYDGTNYWEVKNDRWYPTDRQDVLLRLKAKGISATIPKGSGETVSLAERVLDHIQNVNQVDGAAPLVSYAPGLVQMDNNRVLNITNVRALDPAPEPKTTADFPWIWQFINGLFDRPQEGAVDHFLAWLQRAYSGLLYHKRLMGQAVFLCGPKENGKSLLCYRIIKPMMGNKIANPYDYFTGVTGFNDNLFEAPLLAINDEEGTNREDARHKFIARLKSFVVNPSHDYHPKFCKRTNVQWSGRLFATLNDDPASVALLPEVNANTNDKLMFFGSRAYAGTWEDSAVIEARIDAELPAFARWLLDWKPSQTILVPGRVGVESYFDPRILELSRQQMPAYGLVEVLALWIEQSEAWSGVDHWDGTPERLQSVLNIAENLRANMREWNGQKLARALRTLSQLPGTGVELVSANGGRHYRLHREQLAGKQHKIK